MDIKNELTILVNSCDSYEDLWFPFFKLFDVFAGDLKRCRIILNTEKKRFAYQGLNIECVNNYNKNVWWGERIKTILKQIETEYVLFFLDDYFLRDYVEVDKIEQCIKWLDENKNIGCFNFIPIETASIESDHFKGFCEMPLGINYRCNAQAALWRKNILDVSMLSIENPWEWEVYGNTRNNTILSETRFYSLKFNTPFVVDYGFIDMQKSRKDYFVIDSGVRQGKWNLELLQELFDKYDINIDYSIRGVYNANKDENKTTQNSVADKLGLKNAKKHSKFYSLIAKITRPIRKPFIFMANSYMDKKRLKRRQRILMSDKLAVFVDKPLKEFFRQNKNWDWINYKE